MTTSSSKARTPSVFSTVSWGSDTGSTTSSAQRQQQQHQQLSRGHHKKLFTASRLERGSSAALDSLTIGDISAVASLRREMTQAQVVREELKQLIDDSQYLVTNHHGQYALENVTLYRETESLREAVIMKEDKIRRLRKEVEIAEREHARLQEVNSKLLQGVREKDREKSRVMVRLEAHEYCERNAQDFGASVDQRTGHIAASKAEVVGATTQFVSKLGKHHSEVMVLEQEMLDLKIEADLLRSKLGLIGSLDPTSQAAQEIMQQIPQQQQRSSVWYFRSCENAQCVRDRQNLRQAKDRLKQIEATLRLSGANHLLKSAGDGSSTTNRSATPSHHNQTPPDSAASSILSGRQDISGRRGQTPLSLDAISPFK